MGNPGTTCSLGVSIKSGEFHLDDAGISGTYFIDRCAAVDPALERAHATTTGRAFTLRMAVYGVAPDVRHVGGQHLQSRFFCFSVPVLTREGGEAYAPVFDSSTIAISYRFRPACLALYIASSAIGMISRGLVSSIASMLATPMLTVTCSDTSDAS